MLFLPGKDSLKCYRPSEHYLVVFIPQIIITNGEQNVHQERTHALSAFVENSSGESICVR